MKKFSIKAIFFNHLVSYPTPSNFSYFFNMGSLSGICLGIQLVTGILLAMYYSSSSLIAFESVEYIMRQVQGGWFLRYAHSNGASFFFFVIYIHMARGFFYSSYNYEMRGPWLSGFVIYMLLMGTAFLGYVLPWGQMSFWGATVITNFLSAIPLIGQDLVYWLWGGFAVGGATLSRFFSLHYLLPFLITLVVMIHLAYLHESGSSSPVPLELDSRDLNQNNLFFYPYFYIKDLLGLLVFLFFFSFFLFYAPNYLGHSDNYIEANPLVTPEHIVPEWYFLPFYAILRSIPSKIGGILAMVAALIFPLLLPLIFGFIQKIFLLTPIYPKTKNWELVLFFFFGVFLFLGWLGAQPIEDPYPLLGLILTILYFFLILLMVIMPFLNGKRWTFFFSFLQKKKELFPKKSPFNLKKNSYLSLFFFNIFEEWLEKLNPFLDTLGNIPFYLLYMVMVLIHVAYFTLLERKIIAAVQRRLGPNRVGFGGFGQPWADMLKLITKETPLPRNVNKGLFLFAPILSLAVALSLWFFIPISFHGVYFLGVNPLLMIMALSSLSVYALIFAGWASRGKYSYLGTFRGISQMLSYEILLSLLFLPAIAFSESLDFYEIVRQQQADWYINYFLFIPAIHLITVLVETNRTPFDLTESEGELISGFQNEYGSLSFSLFFLGEYTNISALSMLMAILYFGGWELSPVSAGFLDYIKNFLDIPNSHYYSNYSLVHFYINYKGEFFFNWLDFFLGSTLLLLKMQFIVLLIILLRAILPRVTVFHLAEFYWIALLPLSLIYPFILFINFFIKNLIVQRTDWNLFISNFVDFSY